MRLYCPHLRDAPKMVGFGWRITAGFALWAGIFFAGCFSSHNTNKSSVQTEQERDSETKVHSAESVTSNQGISSKRESLRIEMQPDSVRVCPGECIDITVDVRGGNPPYHFSWDHELSSATTAGPHEVCPDSDTTYTVTVRDVGLNSEEFVIPSEQVQGSTMITVTDDCVSSILLDAGDDANMEDASAHSDVDASDIEDASDDSTNDAGESMTNAPCIPNCPDLQWVTIEGGTFMMGSAEGTGEDNERPQHEVTVKTFKMSKTEVTVAQYGICVDAGVCSEPHSANSTFNWGKSGRENHPVNGVDWHQVREFASWLGGRLPSEAEWEYAARSRGQDIVYPWGNEDAGCEYAVILHDDGCGNGTTMEVCSKPLSHTAQGLCDMAGNVWERVEDDWHESYSGAGSDGQAWIDSPRSSSRVLRGGGWLSIPNDCRSTSRIRNDLYLRNHDAGFRVVLEIE